MDKTCLTVLQLRTALEKYPDRLKILLSSDDLGTHTRPLEVETVEVVGRERVIVLWPSREEVQID